MNSTPSEYAVNSLVLELSKLPEIQQDMIGVPHSEEITFYDSFMVSIDLPMGIDRILTFTSQSETLLEYGPSCGAVSLYILEKSEVDNTNRNILVYMNTETISERTSERASKRPYRAKKLQCLKELGQGLMHSLTQFNDLEGAMFISVVRIPLFELHCEFSTGVSKKCIEEQFTIGLELARRPLSPKVELVIL